MHQIIYLSRATQALTTMDLIGLLVRSRSHNQQVGITGSLVYGEGQFMQVLEGEEAAVRALYEAIVRDPRHRAILKLADKPVAGRIFAGWSMAFRELSPAHMAELEGYLTPAQWERAVPLHDAVNGPLLKRMHEIVLMRGI